MAKKIQLSPIRELYIVLKEVLRTEADALRDNITAVFWDEIKDKINSRELNNIAVRGEVASGKSTVAAKILWEGAKYLEKKGLKPKQDKDDYIEWIFSDQTEFLRFANQGHENRFIQIDEYNRLAEGGINSTSEQMLFDYYSEVFAQKNIHRVTCSPHTLLDRNATIILDVQGKNMKEKMTRCKLTYRDPIDGTQLVLGKVNIYVGDIMETKWYAKYRKKKFNRMGLLDKHGVRDIRELEFAEHALQTYTELIPMARIGKVNQGLVKSKAQGVIRRHKMIYSMIAILEIVDKAANLLTLTTEKYKYQKMLEKAQKGTQRTEPDDERAKQIMEALEIIGTELGNSIAEEEAKRNLYIDYLAIR